MRSWCAAGARPNALAGRSPSPNCAIVKPGAEGRATRRATFRCYGTLVGWNGGLRAALGSDDLLERYHQVEPEVQRETPGMSYRQVMEETARRIDAPDPADTLPEWPAFPGSPRGARARSRERLGRLVASSPRPPRLHGGVRRARIGVPFEFAIVASEVGSYKPALGHWRAFEEKVGRLPDVHVAASLFHDIAPSNELGLKSVWVNRDGEEPGRARHGRSPTCPRSRRAR